MAQGHLSHPPAPSQQTTVTGLARLQEKPGEIRGESTRAQGHVGPCTETGSPPVTKVLEPQDVTTSLRRLRTPGLSLMVHRFAMASLAAGEWWKQPGATHGRGQASCSRAKPQTPRSHGRDEALSDRTACVSHRGVLPGGAAGHGPTAAAGLQACGVSGGGRSTATERGPGVTGG